MMCGRKKKKKPVILPCMKTLEAQWMDGWMDEQMDGWRNGWMNRWMDGWINGWTDGCMYE
jgi:hypothetical protein